MVSPINYVLGGQSPVQQLFEGVGFGVGLRQQEQALQQGQQQMDIAASQEARAAELQPLQVQSAQLGIEGQRGDLERQRQIIEAQDRELARQEAFQMSMGRLAELGADATLQDFQRVGAAFPEFGDAVRETWDALDENRRTGVKTRLLQIGAAIKGGQTETAIQLGEEYAEAAENSGDTAAAATARGMVEAIKASPQAGLAAIGMTLGAVDPDAMGSLFSNAKVQRSTLVGNGRINVQTMTDGTTRVVDTATNEVLTGQAATDAIAAAEEAGIAEQAGRAGARTGATLEARAEGGEAATAAEARGKVIGTAEAEQELQAGSAMQKAQTSLDLVTALKNDPALESIVGTAQGRLSAGIPGVTGGQAGADAMARLSQLTGRVFLEAFESLKGGGQITQIEGDKAQAAIARLDRTQSYDGFIDALTELEDVYRNAIRRAEGQAGSSEAATDTQADDRAFIVEMQAKIERGEDLTPDEVSRIEALAGGGQ